MMLFGNEGLGLNFCVLLLNSLGVFKCFHLDYLRQILAYCHTDSFEECILCVFE
jgi:hypothetical protein